MSARDIVALCQRHISKHSNDCAAFVRAVADACGVVMVGDANAIVGLLKGGRPLLTGVAAKQAASTGHLVIAGLAAPEHGHVVVVVDGPLNRGKYPYAFWGQYHGLRIGGHTMNIGFTRGHGTLNYAFKEGDRDKVKYASFQPLDSLLPRAAPNEGHLLHTFT